MRYDYIDRETFEARVDPDGCAVDYPPTGTVISCNGCGRRVVARRDADHSPAHAWFVELVLVTPGVEDRVSIHGDLCAVCRSTMTVNDAAIALASAFNPTVFELVERATGRRP